jgi:ribosomal protein S18 acetylase RimI-like enzyme
MKQWGGSIMIIMNAELKDLQEILDLQYLAYQSEAKIHNNYSIQPLVQTLEEVEQEFHQGTILKGIDKDGAIIGSVRGYVEGDTLYIGKLIVHPDCQGQGFGGQLLKGIEQVYPNLRYELFTSNKSIKNLGIYEHVGYVRFKEKELSPELKLIYLEKCSD